MSFHVSSHCSMGRLMTFKATPKNICQRVSKQQYILQLRSAKSRGQQLYYWGIKPTKPQQDPLEIGGHYVTLFPALGNTAEVMFYNGFVGVIPH